jgi:hypothetical protein
MQNNLKLIISKPTWYLEHLDTYTNGLISVQNKDILG